MQRKPALGFIPFIFLYFFLTLAYMGKKGR
jgi:hypothetical protein